MIRYMEIYYINTDDNRITPYHDPAVVEVRVLGNQAFPESVQGFLVDALGAHSSAFCMALHEP